MVSLKGYLGSATIKKGEHIKSIKVAILAM